jgi:hypothetical protein
MADVTTADLGPEVGLAAPNDARRLRFREAVAGLSGRARSGDLLRMLLIPGSLLTVGGICLILMGWWGAAHTHRQIEQIPYLISGGVLGLGLVVLGGLLLASSIWMSTLQQQRVQSDERSAAQLAELVASIHELVPPTPAPATRSRNGSRVKAPS